MLPQSKLNDMWQGGYCAAAIEAMRGTEPSVAAGAQRREWMEQHIEDCADCRHASALKYIEYRTAEALGAAELFHGGGDITVLPGFGEAFGEEMRQAREHGVVTPEFSAWLLKKARRAGEPYRPPGTSGN